MHRYREASAPVKASFWFIVCSFLQKGFAFLTTPLFTRMMEKSEYGVVNLYHSWMAILSVVITFKLESGVFNKAMIRYEDDKDGYTSSTLFLITCFVAGFFLIYILGRPLWNSLLGLNTVLMVAMFLEILLTTAMALWSIRQRFEYRYRSVILLTLTTYVVGTTLGVFAVSHAQTDKALWRVVSMVATQLVIYSGVYYQIMRKGRKLVVPAYWKYALAYNLPLIPHYLSQLLLTQSDKIMIGRICGNDYVAIYAVAQQVALVMNMVLVSVDGSFTPWAFQKIKNRDYSPIARMTLILEICISAICFVFSLFAPELVMILGGESYYAAIWVIPPITMSVVFNTVYSLISVFAFYYEKTTFVMIGTFIATVVNLVLNAIFIPIYGFVAASYTTLFCYLLYSLLHYCFMVRVCKANGIAMPYSNRKIWGVALGAMALSALASILYQHTILRYAVVAAAVLGCVVKRKALVRLVKSLRADSNSQNAE